MRHHPVIRLPAIALATLLAGTTFGQSRGATGPPGTGGVTIGARHIRAAVFHRQGFMVEGPFESKTTMSLDAKLAVSDELTLHVGTGWAEFFAASGGSPSGGPEKHDGRQDTTLGVTWRLNGGARPAGTITAIRIGGRIPGPYDAGYTNSLGDGATELQGSFVIENFDGRIRWSSEIGYRSRTHAIVNPAGIGEVTDHHEKVDVPNETFAFAGVYAGITRQLQIGFEYSGVNGHHGLDIDREGWRSDRWPALHEDIHTIGLAAHAAGGIAFTAGKVVAGRNTPAYNVYMLSWSRGFRQPWGR